MKLSQIDTTNLTDDQISTIVFSDIIDDLDTADIGIVVGNYNLQKYRVTKAMELYRNKRINKIVLLGGSGGISNESSETKSEAELMKEMLLAADIPDADIIIEDKSKTTIENCVNLVPIIDELFGIENIKKLILISSEFHLKRCLAIFMKYFSSNIKYTLSPAKDGFSDSENWFLSDDTYNSGRGLATFEAKVLVRHAKE